jgi:hypothetical protein
MLIMEKLFSFTIHVDTKHHPLIRAELSKRSGDIKLHAGNKPGRVAPVEALGLVYNYHEVVGHPGDFLIEVVENPHGVTEAELKERIQSELDQIVLAG